MLVGLSAKLAEEKGEMAMEKTMYRIPEKGIIGGVCAGVAEYHDMKPDTVRMIYVFANFLAIPMILTYLFQWLVTPVRE